MNRSFANCRWVIGAKSLANLNPLILLESASLSISFDSTSNARTKRKGERGSPCLSPLCGLKCPNELPLIKIEKEVVVCQGVYIYMIMIVKGVIIQYSENVVICDTLLGPDLT